MTVEIKTVIGQLNIAKGSWRGDAPNQVAVREPQSVAAGTDEAPGAGKGDLFVLVDARGPVSSKDKLEQQLAETIRDIYYMARGSITVSLRRALQEAGSQLYHHNRQTDNEPVIAGVAALVVHNDDAFMAQIGPAAIYVVLSHYIRRYPTESPWLDEAIVPEKVDLPALGTQEVAEPNLHHLHLTPNDVLVLADSGLAGQLPLSDVVKSVLPHNVKATVKNLGKTAKASYCSALVVSVVEDRSTFGALKKNAPDMLKMGGEAVSPLGRFFNLGRRNQAEVPEDVEDPVMEPSAAVEHKITPQAVPPQPTASPEVPEVYYEHEEEDAYEMASMAQNSGFTPSWQESQGAAAASSSAGKVLRWVGTALLMLVALLGRGLKNLLGLVIPNSGDSSSRQAGAHVYRDQPPSVISWTMLRNVAIAIPVIVALVVGVIYLQKGRMVEAEYRGHIDTAQNKFQQAQVVADKDPGTAVGLMEEAQVALNEAEVIKADQPEIATQREQMAVMADEVGNVQRLYYLPQLRQYNDSGTQLKRITVQGADVYVLDSGTDRVFHHRLDDVGETLLSDEESEWILVSKGQQVNEIKVGDILDVAWMPAGGNRQTSDLVMLNTTALMEFNPNFGTDTLALAGGELMKLPVAVASYFGNLYILDPQANRILRYLPTSDGYSQMPEDYFSAEQPVDLSNAVDLAIDGAVYVLFREGRLQKFEGGTLTEFNMTGLDKPLSNPVSVFTLPDEQVQYVYVADAGNQRIVQLEKDGRFVRQFKPRTGEDVSFANLQDIYVDEIGGRLYVLDSNNLYVGNIPAESVAQEQPIEQPQEVVVE